MDRKYKILAIPSDRTGVGKFRSVDPHVYLAKHYADEFDVDIKYLNEIDSSNLEKFFNQYDLIHIHKQADKGLQIMDLLKFLGKKVVIDVDDHWKLGHYHPMALSASRENWDRPIIAHIMKADAVTTTTPIFAKEIRKHNKNVYVLPNAIDPEEKQFIPNKTKNDRLRFGLICGSTHLHDISLLTGINSQLPEDVKEKIQFVLCGFDTRGTRTIYHEKTGEVERRPILPEESTWCDYEKILTDDYKIVKPEHKAFLKQYLSGVDYNDTTDRYMRYWTRDITSYATHYNNIDVLLAPLKECDFNLVKSQLKVIEAGFMDTAIIAQNFGPYTIDLKSVIGKGGVLDETGNALLVEPSKNHKQWAKYITKLTREPEIIDIMKKNLSTLVKDKYSLETVTKKRAELYKKLIDGNK